MFGSPRETLNSIKIKMYENIVLDPKYSKIPNIRICINVL